MAYDTLKVFYQSFVNDQKGKPAMDVVDRLICGALAGSIAQTITYPLVCLFSLS